MEDSAFWMTLAALILLAFAVDLLPVGLPKPRSGELLAAAPDSSIASKSWKSDVEILHGAPYQERYSDFSKGHLHVDQDDRLWLPLTMLFPHIEQTTDASAPLRKDIVLLSEDRGRTWQITGQPTTA